MAYFDFVAVQPAVAAFVPDWFGGTPVGGGQTYSPVDGAGVVGACGVDTPVVHISVIESWMSVMALVSIALVATRLLMMVFFLMDMFARLSREDAICCACSSLAAW